MVKLCPLFLMFPGQPPGDYECVEGKCAWWDGVSGQCAVLSIADSQIELSKRGD